MWRRALVTGVVAAVVHRALAAVVPTASAHTGGLSPFTRWDAGWYLDIAARGYAATDHVHLRSGQVQSAAVFPPVYPALIRAVSAVLSPESAALLVTLVALAVGLAGLYRLVELRAERRVAMPTLLFALAWPASFFFAVAYAEAVVFAAVVWAFLAAAQRRWLLAGACVAIAGLTKTVAFVALLGVLAEWWTSRSRRPAHELAALALPSAAALGAWIAYQAAVLHDPLRFLVAEKQWGRSLAAPWTTIAQGIAAVDAQRSLGDKLPFLLDLAAVALLLAAVVYGWRRIPRAWTVYSAALLLALTVSGRLESDGRYVLIAFPMFIVFALATKEREWMRPLALVVSVVVGVLLAQRFATGAWAG